MNDPTRRAAHDGTHRARIDGADQVLQWLATFPGDSWQQRWSASAVYELGDSWTTAITHWRTRNGLQSKSNLIFAGLLALITADVIRPRLDWLILNTKSRHWRERAETDRDPMGFAQLEQHIGVDRWREKGGWAARCQIAILLFAKGGVIADITVGDCLELRQTEWQVMPSSSSRGRGRFYSWLRSSGSFPEDSPANLIQLGQKTGQLNVEQLVDRYNLECRPIRDLIVDYLTERQPAMDYKSLDSLARVLALQFWRDLETHHPGINTLALDRATATAWKKRFRTKTVRRRQPDGSVDEATSPRLNAVNHLMAVRAFYLDIAQWAMEDPGRWGPWAAPCPVSRADTAVKKMESHRKARMDQRTRERLPILPALVTAAEQRLKDARERLAALRAAAPGEQFAVGGEVFTKSKGHNAHAQRTGAGSDIAYGSDGRQRRLVLEEHRAFWAWATVEFLRHTGVRIEEMLETSHHAITQYHLPETGEVVPLLQIAPSKTDQERLLVIDPELADVLSTIITRVRAGDGRIPLTALYDPAEKVWNPPLPLLFQRNYGGQDRAIGPDAIRSYLHELVTATGLTDSAGRPLHCSPHDFRRIFATDAILNGMPPHIAQLLLGHQDINTTMGYKAIYPQEAINGHRAFISRRRNLRPSEEYRTPTDEEWDEFLGHFERRKVALGDCGRAYGTTCQHEHSCVRCPLLRIDPRQQRRLEEIRSNLADRVAEAEREGWLGEAEGLRVSMAAAENKLLQVDARRRREATVGLGMPRFHEIAARTATCPPVLESR
ncbi:tyrosine-type recombinase/integrase [Nocardia tengchongensis]|uniref:tyrosine-type recombinase/integrase n=1 Tax=Nocardia tengchongensis TaxID=2055889 RepID=UPI003648AB98